MIFSKDKFPILAHLDSAEKLNQFNFKRFKIVFDNPKDVQEKFCAEATKEHSIELIANPSIEFVSKAFDEAVGNSHDSLRKLSKNLSSCSGIFLLNKRYGWINSVGYKVFDVGVNSPLVYHMSIFSSSGRVASIFGQLTEGNVEFVRFTYEQSEDHKKESKSDILIAVRSILMVLALKQFAKIENYYIGKRNRRLKIGGNKFINKQDLTIGVLDSRWFRNIIRTEGFGVRGHFRLQPYGPNMSKKRLIYIKPFEKKGYKSKARINITNEQKDQVPQEVIKKEKKTT